MGYCLNLSFEGCFLVFGPKEVLYGRIKPHSENFLKVTKMGIKESRGNDAADVSLCRKKIR